MPGCAACKAKAITMSTSPHDSIFQLFSYNP